MPILNMIAQGSGGEGGGNIGEPLNLAVTTSGLDATITWEDNEIGTIPPTTFQKSELVRKIGSAPTSPSDGDLVVTETVKDTYKTTGYVDQGLTDGETYYYRVFSYSDLGGISYCEAESITIPAYSGLEFLMVGGGGAGGNASGGGGGAGGVIYQIGYSISSGTYPIVIGAGGVGASGDSGGWTTKPATLYGGDTTFLGLTAVGGGCGGCRNRDQSVRDGGDGGCGGGSCGWGGNSVGGNAITGQGYIGGDGYSSSGVAGQGGGGGAGGAGDSISSNIGGNGGDGIINPIVGSTVGELIDGKYWLAGGGGGCSGWSKSNTQGIGGKGGGGDGASISTPSHGTAGGDATTYGAGGGGGGLEDYNVPKGGDGYQGIVIIRYKTGYITATGGTVTTSGGLTTHIFTSDGNFVVS